MQLTFFCAQVDASGKVERLRKQCPQCGPGTFMATHFDRVYCGKCGTTFLYEQVRSNANTACLYQETFGVTASAGSPSGTPVTHLGECAVWLVGIDSTEPR